MRPWTAIALSSVVVVLITLVALADTPPPPPVGSIDTGTESFEKCLNTGPCITSTWLCPDTSNYCFACQRGFMQEDCFWLDLLDCAWTNFTAGHPQSCGKRDDGFCTGAGVPCTITIISAGFCDRLTCRQV